MIEDRYNGDIYKNYQLLLEHSQEIIIFFNREGYITASSEMAKQVLGYSHEIVEVSVTDIFCQAINKDQGDIFIHKKFKDKISETVAYRKNQTCLLVDLKVTIIENNNEYIGICNAIDRTNRQNIISDLKKALQEANEAKKVKDEFLANITHELRTPINGIMGLTENMLESELSPRQIETLNIIHRCCSNMTSIINNLLDFSKIVNGKIVLEQREFDVRKLINEIIALNINKMNEKGLTLYLNVATNVPQVVIGDELRLTQILNNLFSNAVKFTSVGQIALEVVKTAQTDKDIELFFVLMDTGIGISPDEMDKLFQSFSQVDGSITRRFGGTGLGLAICKQLVELMNGVITVDSEKGKGSTFSFSVRFLTPTLPEETESEWNDRNVLRDDDSITRSYYDRTNPYPEQDYIGKMLGQANIYTPNMDRLSEQINSIMQYEKKESQNEISITVEKLAICIEMENWDKSESLINYLKNVIPKENEQLAKKFLKLVLAVRKEDHDKSINILNELKEMIREVN